MEDSTHMKCPIHRSFRFKLQLKSLLVSYFKIWLLDAR